MLLFCVLTLITPDSTFFFPGRDCFYKFLNGIGVEFYENEDYILKLHAILRYLVHAIGFKLSSEGVQTDAQQPGGAGFIVTHLFINAKDVFFFYLSQSRNRILRR